MAWRTLPHLSLLPSLPFFSVLKFVFFVFYILYFKKFKVTSAFTNSRYTQPRRVVSCRAFGGGSGREGEEEWIAVCSMFMYQGTATFCCTQLVPSFSLPYEDPYRSPPPPPPLFVTTNSDKRKRQKLYEFYIRATKWTKTTTTTTTWRYDDGGRRACESKEEEEKAGRGGSRSVHPSINTFTANPKSRPH